MSKKTHFDSTSSGEIAFPRWSEDQSDDWTVDSRDLDRCDLERCAKLAPKIDAANQILKKNSLAEEETLCEGLATELLSR